MILRQFPQAVGSGCFLEPSSNVQKLLLEYSFSQNAVYLKIFSSNLLCLAVLLICASAEIAIVWKKFEWLTAAFMDWEHPDKQVLSVEDPPVLYASF